MKKGIFFVLLACAIARNVNVQAFQSARPIHSTSISVSVFSSEWKRKKTALFDAPQESEEEKVEVGTKEYYDGFLSSPIQDETVAERGSGLEQALKLGGGFALVLAVLFVGFMASNGLL